jgi:hypothetical protein
LPGEKLRGEVFKTRCLHPGKRRATRCESTESVRLTWEALQKPPWLGEWETGQVDVKAVASGRKSQTERKQLADALRGKSKASSVTMVVTTWTSLGDSRTPAVTSGRRERAAFSWCLVASRKGRITTDGRAWPPSRLERERSTPRMWGRTLRTGATGVKRCRLFSRTLSSEALPGSPPCRTQVKVSLVTALASQPRSSAVARRFLCSRHDGSNHVEARRTQGSKECAPDPAAENWIAWLTGHAGRGLKRSANRSWLSSFAPTTIFLFVRGLCV